MKRYYNGTILRTGRTGQRKIEIQLELTREGILTYGGVEIDIEAAGTYLFIPT